jgi:hypothetical protein
MTDRKNDLDNCSLDMITDAPEFQEIIDFGSLHSHPRFKFRVQKDTDSLELISEIIAEYKSPIQIQCAFGHWHQHGFIAVLNDGVITQLGNRCSSKGSFKDDFIRRKNQFENIRDRRDLLKALEGLGHEMVLFEAHSSRSTSDSTLGMALHLVRMRSELPTDVQYHLNEMGRSRVNQLVAVRRSSQRETQVQSLFGRGPRNDLTREVICQLSGAQCLWPDFDVRKLINDSRTKIKRLQDFQGFSSRTERVQVSSDLDNLRTNNQQLSRANGMLRAFLKEDNLRQLERAIDGKGGKKLLRRIAHTYALNDINKAA